MASAEWPNNLRAVRATGPGKAGQIDGQRVVFPPLDSLAPDAEATFSFYVQGLFPGHSRFRAEVRSVMLPQPLRAAEPPASWPARVDRAAVNHRDGCWELRGRPAGASPAKRLPTPSRGFSIRTARPLHFLDFVHSHGISAKRSARSIKFISDGSHPPPPTSSAP